MIEVRKILTNDGKMFNTERDAKHHIENEYNGVISELALLIRGTENATKLKLIIDDNIDVLRKIVELKDELSRGVKPYES